MITHYFLNDTNYQLLVNGYNFGANQPPFATIDGKHYITVDNWSLWVSSRPNELYSLSVFTQYSTVEELTIGIFETLTDSEYQAHKENLSNNPEAFIERERVICDQVHEEMAAELHRQLENNTINSLQGLQLQELFSKQEPMSFPSLGGVTLHISIMGYLSQNKSLGAALNRLVNTPVDDSIGFSQSLKDYFIGVINKGLTALNA